MPGKSSALEHAVLANIFNATIDSALVGILNNPSSGSLASLYVALHTADPTDSGSQTTNECAYVGYGRVAVARSAAGWTVTANSVSPVANIDFPACTSGTSAATHFSIGTALTGAGTILYSGAITPNISITVGTMPRLTPASIVTES